MRLTTLITALFWMLGLPSGVLLAAEPGPIDEFTAEGIRIRVDRQPQQLHIEAPQPEAWLHESVRGNIAAEVVAGTTPLRKGDRTLMVLGKGRKLFITTVEGQWVGATILVEGQPQAGWVKLADLKPLPDEVRVYRHMQNAGGEFISAAMLVQKAKQFDDGLYAAVELAAEGGLGEMPAKSQLLREWAVKVDPRGAGGGLGVVLAAGKLGGLDVTIPAGKQREVADLLAQFQADEQRSKPLGFYTWSPELEAIFRQDRMLQTPLPGADEVKPLVAALTAERALLDAYLKHLLLAYRLTNPPIGGSSSDLRPLVQGNGAAPASVTDWHVLPPSTSHETQLFLRLFAGGDVPEKFELMQALIDEVRAGRIDLAPTANSGWYDHQTWAIQPLLMPEKMPEASHLQVGKEYGKLLEDLFKGTLALTRETHVKQLGVPAPASAVDQPEPKPPLVIAPQLSVEPLATFYLRRAESYAFVRKVLTEAFGEDALGQMHRQTAEGPLDMSLDRELDAMQKLFLGAHATALQQLGMSAAEEPEAGEAFRAWAKGAAADPDLGRDCRMMVPVYTNMERTKIKVWCILGWSPKSAWASFAKQPAVSGTDAAGKPVVLADHFDVTFGGQSLALASPRFAEVWVTRLLNREEFRRHCDTYVTPAVILANLE